MIIRCYGARGSIPVSGRDYLKYGGDTTCVEIRTRNDEIIIVDAGSGIRRLGNRLVQEGRSDCHVLFTHSHYDHILGFPFFKPLYHEGTRIRLTGCPTTQGNLEKLISKAMTPPYFPVLYEELKAHIEYAGECPLKFKIDSVEIFNINLSHTNLGLGYKFVEDGKSFVFLTDNELGYRHRDGQDFDDYVSFSKGADLLFHDAEYDPQQYGATRTWGHSTYPEALNLAVAAGVKRFGLFHHNQDRTDAQLDAIVEQCRRTLREKHPHMECFAVSQTFQIEL
jgi:phosphoribosyl 1,2-cyclic phosphodiesterase